MSDPKYIFDNYGRGLTWRESPQNADAYYDQYTGGSYVYKDGKWIEISDGYEGIIEELCERYPNLKESRERLIEAQNEFDVLVALLREYK
jgi:hypothetical protein